MTQPPHEERAKSLRGRTLAIAFYLPLTLIGPSLIITADAIAFTVFVGYDPELLAPASLRSPVGLTILAAIVALVAAQLGVPLHRVINRKISPIDRHVNLIDRDISSIDRDIDSLDQDIRFISEGGSLPKITPRTVRGRTDKTEEALARLPKLEERLRELETSETELTNIRVAFRRLQESHKPQPTAINRIQDKLTELAETIDGQLDILTSTGTEIRARIDFLLRKVKSEKIAALEDKRSLLSPLAPPTRSIVARFGLDPIWAAQQLEEFIAPRAMRQLLETQRIRAAQCAGLAVAAIIGCLEAAYLFFTIRLLVAGYLTAAAAMASALLTFSRLQELRFSWPRFYFSAVERLLERYRFEVYKALRLKLPSSTRDEQRLTTELSRWQAGRPTELNFVLEPDNPTHDDLARSIDSLSTAIQGPELIAYRGFLSWQFNMVSDLHAADTTGATYSIKLIFASVPVAADGSVEISVQGIDKPYAPFEIAADADQGILTRLQTSLDVPTDGRPTYVTMELSEIDPLSKPEIWIELSQNGRFVKVVRASKDTPGYEDAS